MHKVIIAGSLTMGVTALAVAQQPTPVPGPVPVRELTPVVTSIVITAPYGAPPEIRITVASPYAGAKVTTDTHTTGDRYTPAPAPVPVPAPKKAERRPFATIDEAPAAVAHTGPTRPPGAAARAAQLEAPYRRTPLP